MSFEITGLAIRGFVSPVTDACRPLDHWPVAVWSQWTFPVDHHMTVCVTWRNGLAENCERQFGTCFMFDDLSDRLVEDRGCGFVF